VGARPLPREEVALAGKGGGASEREGGFRCNR